MAVDSAAEGSRAVSLAGSISAVDAIERARRIATRPHEDLDLSFPSMTSSRWRTRSAQIGSRRVRCATTTELDLTDPDGHQIDVDARAATMGVRGASIGRNTASTGLIQRRLAAAMGTMLDRDVPRQTPEIAACCRTRAGCRAATAAHRADVEALDGALRAWLAAAFRLSRDFTRRRRRPGGQSPTLGDACRVSRHAAPCLRCDQRAAAAKRPPSGSSRDRHPLGRRMPILRSQSGCRDLNSGPLRPERSALPGCATPRARKG